MPLAPGARVGPYEVLGSLGAGGMGEVYRARDTRLNRDVAIKILPDELVHDPDRRARFEREAQVVSALNHPNIVTLYETGTSDAGPYLVLEKVDGQSLRGAIDAGPLPIRKLVDLGAQIAAGLAKAHAAGVVHRDLKPENVMMTSDGFAKILDFGLARLVWPDEGLGETAETETLVKQTASGVILGTLGYLSPEQAAGKPADYRADQFALGALLYEMATGVRPFKRATVLESLTATIREEPEPVRARRADLPSPLAWLIERCLAKNPDDRYASTKDLARDLGDIRDRLSEISRMPGIDPRDRGSAGARSRAIRWALALAAVTALVVGTFVVARRTAVAPVPSYRPLTFAHGTITGARFSPDGGRVYYSATYEGQSRIFVTQLDRTESEELKSLPSGFLMGVSTRNELAILETNERDCCGPAGIIARVSAIGGTPLPVADGVSYADWASDGERIVVSRQGGNCEYANGPPISSSCGQIRASPKNDDVAFMTEGGLKLQDAAGATITAIKFRHIYGLAWSPDGRELWFTGSESASPNDRAIYVLSRDGKYRLVARAPGALTIYDVGRDGKSALISTGSNWLGINASTEHGERALDLFGRTALVGFSDDGQSVLLNEDREVGRGAWLRSVDGKPPVPLSDDAARGLSPDGKWALLERKGKSSALLLQPIGVGHPRDVPIPSDLETPGNDWHASWSSDGRRMFVPFNRRSGAGRARQIYLFEGDGPGRPVTPEVSAGMFAVSANGEFVATPNPDGIVTIYAIDGGPPVTLNNERGRPVHWSTDGRQLLLAGPELFPASLYHRDIVTGVIQPWRTLAPADTIGVTAIAQMFTDRAERAYVYQYGRALNDLFLAQNLR